MDRGLRESAAYHGGFPGVPPMQIVVAEDTPNTLALIQRLLEEWGHEVTAVENGEQALKVLQEGRARVVVSDWMMPVVDGIELCRRIRKRTWDHYIYVIILTSRQGPGDIAAAMRMGADDYANKPVDAEELKARLQAARRVLALETQLADRVNELQASLDTIQKLKELVPICMYCHSIRDDQDYWTKIETVLADATGARLSHGICPDCYEKIAVPDLEALKRSLKGDGEAEGA